MFVNGPDEIDQINQYIRELIGSESFQEAMDVLNIERDLSGIEQND